MSGGSWDYVCFKFESVADDLEMQRCPYRRALGKHINLIAKAMKAVEWVDSGDCSPPHDINAIKDVLRAEQTISVLKEDAEKLIAQLQELTK